jgi:gluconate 2-dehydrogenase subunit 3-like protein
MAKNEPLDFRQDRRAWLKTSATVLGSALLPLPPVSAQTAAPSPDAQPASSESAGPFFTPAQHALIEELAETIIPADSHSGGAKAAKVADYIEHVVGMGADQQRKAFWKEGLRLVDAMSQHRAGKSFVDASPEERIAVLSILSDHDDLTDLPEIRFFHELKHLTVRGYYTSKIGIHDELEYKGNKVLAEFVGCDEPAKESS